MISILCPTRNRQGELKRMVESACDTASHPQNIEILFRMDDDDRTEHVFDAPCRLFTLTGTRHKIMCDNWNDLIPHALGSIFMCGNDDIEFKTPGWDQLIEAEFSKYPDGILLVGGDDGFTRGRAIPHPFVSRRWVELQGYFSAPYFESDYGTDTWNEDIAQMVNRRVYLPNLLIFHHHPAFGTGPQDDTYKERMTRHAQQNPGLLYMKLKPERMAIANKFREAMACSANAVAASEPR